MHQAMEFTSQPPALLLKNIFTSTPKNIYLASLQRRSKVCFSLYFGPFRMKHLISSRISTCWVCSALTDANAHVHLHLLTVTNAQIKACHSFNVYVCLKFVVFCRWLFDAEQLVVCSWKTYIRKTQVKTTIVCEIVVFLCIERIVFSSIATEVLLLRVTHIKTCSML